MQLACNFVEKNNSLTEKIFFFEKMNLRSHKIIISPIQMDIEEHKQFVPPTFAGKRPYKALSEDLNVLGPQRRRFLIKLKIELKLIISN